MIYALHEAVTTLLIFLSPNKGEKEKKQTVKANAFNREFLSSYSARTIESKQLYIWFKRCIKLKLLC